MERVLLVENGLVPELSLAANLEAAGFLVELINPYNGDNCLSVKYPPNVTILNTYDDAECLSKLYTDLEQNSATAVAPIIQVIDEKSAECYQCAVIEDASGVITSPVEWNEMFLLIQAMAKNTKKFRRAYEREVDKTLTKMASTLSHEVFLPLIEIEATSDYLVQACSRLPNAEMTAMLNDISDAAHQVHRMLTRMSLLDTLRKEAAQSHQTKGAALDLYSLVEEVAYSTAQRHRRDEDVVIDVERVTIRVPAVDLTQIVEELVEFALLASRRGDRVTIWCKAADSCELGVDFRPEITP